MKKIVLITLLVVIGFTTKAQWLKKKLNSDKLYRPAIHFTPKAGWMNDPNGMIYVKGVYHLYYQHNPNASVWGPMHWGHATSKDLIHWKHQKIALYPNDLGTIFSGSAVIDSNNTSGFGRGRKAPSIVWKGRKQEEMIIKTKVFLLV
jgi:fructan beta-fructosidase